MLAFFASVRMTLASTDVVGKTAVQYIQSVFVPRLKSIASKGEKDADKATESLALWEQFSDPKKSSDWRLWDNIGMGQIWTAARKYGIRNPDMVEEAASSIVHDLFVRGHFDRVFAKYDPLPGPMAFAPFWKTIWMRRADMYFRDQRAKQPKVVFYDEQGNARNLPIAPISLHDTGATDDDRNLMETLRAPKDNPDEDIRLLQDLKDAMDSHIEAKFGDNKMTMDIYKQWMKAAEKLHGKNVNFVRDVWTPLFEKYKKRGDSLPRVTATRHYKLLVNEVVRFFERVEGKRLSDAVKRKLNLAARVMVAEYQQRFATWMLAPYRARLHVLSGLV